MSHNFLQPILIYFFVLVLGFMTESLGRNGKKVAYYFNLLANGGLFAFLLLNQELNLTKAFQLSGMSLKSAQMLFFCNISVAIYNGNQFLNSSRQLLLNSLLTSAGLFVLGSQDFLGLFVASEIMMVLFIVLISLSQFNRSRIIAFRFFIQAGLSTIVMGLFGVFFLAATGGFHFIDIKIINHDLFALSLIFFVMLGAFRIGIFPFHHWVAEVYSTLGNIPIGGSLLIVRTVFTLVTINLIQQFLPEVSPTLQSVLIGVIESMAIISIVYGSLLAYTDHCPRRAVAHLLMACSGVIFMTALFSYQAVISERIQLFIFSSGLAGTSLYWIFHQVLPEGGDFSDLRQLFYKKRFEGLLFLVFILSLIGAPITAGFQSRLLIFMSYLNEGFTISFLVALFSSILGLALAFKFFRQVFDLPSVQPPPAPDNGVISLRDRSIQLLFFAIIVIIGIMPSVYFY